MNESMQIARPDHYQPCEERTLYESLLPLAGATIAELGCGAANHTRQIAEGHPDATLHAFEVDSIQHTKNLQIDDLPNVTFTEAGAEAIPLGDASCDVVLMFKSLHHVPLDLMDRAFGEIARILKPGGYAYISEPVYAGAFNEILRLFHDEKAVREAAFEATRRAAASDAFELAGQHFIDTPSRFADFSEFEQRIIGATHSHHALSPELLATVRAQFEAHMGPEGVRFEMPIRVDLLRRAG